MLGTLLSYAPPGSLGRAEGVLNMAKGKSSGGKSGGRKSGHQPLAANHERKRPRMLHLGLFTSRARLNRSTVPATQLEGGQPPLADRVSRASRLFFCRETSRGNYRFERPNEPPRAAKKFLAQWFF
jgi:hypothetical protein